MDLVTMWLGKGEIPQSFLVVSRRIGPKNRLNNSEKNKASSQEIICIWGRNALVVTRAVVV